MPYLDSDFGWCEDGRLRTGLVRSFVVHVLYNSMGCLASGESCGVDDWQQARRYRRRTLYFRRQAHARQHLLVVVHLLMNRSPLSGYLSLPILGEPENHELGGMLIARWAQVQLGNGNSPLYQRCLRLEEEA